MHSAGGRLATPLLAVLDEAANVCRWRDLPDLYSHYGSRGIVLMTILQSWSQGVGVWGESGMKKLWSAANVKVYGGGVCEASFLEDLSRTIGDHDRPTSSVTTGRGGQGVSHQLQRDRILDVADLAALPKGPRHRLRQRLPPHPHPHPTLDDGPVRHRRPSVHRRPRPPGRTHPPPRPASSHCCRARA
ncbi:TraG/TraD/VirD4 family protein [Jannaschia sp. R86511]|uniref:TraG/TraD/VirD4 family protein n=1 Tax=Jannaschia sp. R86511 TaxID=3093853 RepID=UPI0036D2836C